jgi:hypothetical protein
MRLTWRDGVTTALVTLALFGYLGYLAGWAVPVLDDVRGITLVLGILGLASCIIGGGSMTSFSGAYVAAASALGVAALGLVVLGLTLGWTLAPLLLAVDVVVLWIVATTHHAVSSDASMRPA